VEFSSNVIGDGFKFRDYLESVGIIPYMPVCMRVKKSLPEIPDDTGRFDNNNLLMSCPFKHLSIHEGIEGK
jgi:hypothetical protein